MNDETTHGEPRVYGGSMPVDVAHWVAKDPSRYLMSDIVEALRVFSARIRALEGTVLTGCAICDKHPLRKPLSPEEQFEVLEGQ